MAGVGGEVQNTGIVTSRGACAPWDCPALSAQVHRLEALQDHYDGALAQMQAALMRLDSSRRFTLLEQCRLYYGRQARRQASQTLQQWRDGHPAVPCESAVCLFTLLPGCLTDSERLSLLRGLRQSVLERRPTRRVALRVRHTGDLATIAPRMTDLLSAPEQTPTPPEVLAAQTWLAHERAQGFHVMARETEHVVAACRLTALMAQIGALQCLRALPGTTVFVRVQFEAPTALVRIEFRPAFWRRTESSAVPTTPDRDDGAHYTERVLRALSPEDRMRWWAVAEAERLRLGALAQEIRARTEAACDDIRAAVALVERLRARGLWGRVHLECSAADTPRIDVRCTTGNLLSFALLDLQQTVADGWRRRIHHAPATDGNSHPVH